MISVIEGVKSICMLDILLSCLTVMHFIGRWVSFKIIKLKDGIYEQIRIFREEKESL